MKNIRANEGGVINILLIPLITSTVLLVAMVGFGAWAFMERQDYKNNSDQKVNAAVEVAKKQTATEKDNEFLEKEKFPLKNYSGPADLGSLVLSYPKTWSGYISDNDGKFFIFNPDIVTERNDPRNALRITIEDSPYSDVVSNFDGQVEDGSATATIFALPKVPDAVGVRFDGEYENDMNGAIVILPMRDKTIMIACEIPDRLADFNNIILPNLSFKP